MTINNSSIIFYRKNIDSKLTLFCYPYAGGSAAVYKPWLTYLPNYINLAAIELPGRGTRYSESLVNDLDQLILEITRTLSPYLQKPYVFFGHSMGAILAFEVTKRLRSLHQKLPNHIFLSAREGPRYVEDPNKLKHKLSDTKFIDYLRNNEGTPEELLINKELMNLLLPMLRLDHKIVETYGSYYNKEKPLLMPITVFAGKGDDVSKKWLQDWRQETLGKFNIEFFPGKHFFIFPQRKEIITSILQHCSKY